MSDYLKCLHCGRKDFRSRRGLIQHQISNKTCHEGIKASLNIVSKSVASGHTFMEMSNVVKPKATAMQVDPLALFASMTAKQSQLIGKTAGINTNKRSTSKKQNSGKLECSLVIHVTTDTYRVSLQNSFHTDT